MLAWGQARFKFGVVMTSHLMLAFQAFFTCFIRFYALSCIVSKWFGVELHGFVESINHPLFDTKS